MQVSQAYNLQRAERGEQRQNQSPQTPGRPDRGASSPQGKGHLQLHPSGRQQGKLGRDPGHKEPFPSCPMALSQVHIGF